MVNSRIGPYKIIREIAEDRLGYVLEAIDLTSKKHVVIKSLRPEAANRPEIVSRLYSEATTLALLNHPHIARIFGFIRRNDRLYLVMEFIEGESLQAILKAKTRLDPTIALAFFRHILSAVAFAHELGVIHGDLRPANIMVSTFGQVKVLDFAIATILGNPDPTGPRASMLTYVSPEQVRREPVDVRSDIYSLGVLLYELIVGRTPFNRDSELAFGSRESTPLLPSLLVANCPRWLDQFVLRALAPSPADRFQSVAAMSQALGSPVEAKMTVKPRRAWAERGTRWMSSEPALLFTAAHQMWRSGRGAIGTTANIIRQKRASAARTVRSGMETINPVTSFKRGATKINAWMHGIVSELAGISSTTVGNAKKMARQKNDIIMRAVRLRTEAIHPSVWTKSGAARLRDWTRAFQATPMRIHRRFGSLKENFAAFSEGGWQRYVAITIVVASVLIETFIFGGSNTLLRPDNNPSPAISQNGAAQSILDQLDPTPIAAGAPDPGAELQPQAAKRMNVQAKTPAKPSRDAEHLHYEARAARRTVTYRSDWYNFPRPNVRAPRAGEPIPASRNAENNTAKTQLNVKWEN